MSRDLDKPSSRQMLPERKQSVPRMSGRYYYRKTVDSPYILFKTYCPFLESDMNVNLSQYPRLSKWKSCSYFPCERVNTLRI